MTLVTSGARRRSPASSGLYPSAAPWNALAPQTVPTADGHGSIVHPSVVDLGGAPVSGYRYWMAGTPYWHNKSDLENPHIWASNDGWDWVVPSGVVNPLVQKPAGAGDYNADTDLIWDPDTNRFVLYYLRTLNLAWDGSPFLTSPDGITWTPGNWGGSFTLNPKSLSIIRIAAGQWQMILSGNSFVSASSTGPWTWIGTDWTWANGQPPTWWHHDVLYANGVWYAVIHSAGNGANPPGHIWGAVSTNGLTWHFTPPLIQPGVSWEQALYRPTLTLDGEYIKVWYTGDLTAGYVGDWRLAHTRIPRSAWTNLLP